MENASAHRTKVSKMGTAIGFISVVLWGSLALLTDLTGGRFPPFQMLAMTFTIASLVLASKFLFFDVSVKKLLQISPFAMLLGIGGLFLYHLFYFIALANAPAIEASLINYLWPLCIVLFSAFLPGERLTLFHLLGAICALFGCFLLLRGDVGFQSQYLWGYGAALISALLWSSYSVLSRLVRDVSSDAVIIYCAATALLAWGCHFGFEMTLWPRDPVQIFAIFGLGIGPVGIAFFTWDYGVKHGDIQLLGILSYAAPLISTLLLILLSDADFTLSVMFACFAIIGGAFVANYRGKNVKDKC